MEKSDDKKKKKSARIIQVGVIKVWLYYNIHVIDTFVLRGLWVEKISFCITEPL